MAQVTMKASLLLFLVALLAVSTVHARPIHQAKKENQGQASKLESRSPRLIPDTKHFLGSLIDDLGLTEPTPTTTPSSPPTPRVESDQGNPESPKASSTTRIIYSSSTSYTPTQSSNGPGYTHTVKHETNQKKPIENVQLGHGWKMDHKLTSEDFPAIFEAVDKELKHRLSDMINSSDEIGLDSFIDWTG